MAAQAPFAVQTPPPSSRDVLALDYQWTNEQIKLLTDIRFRLLTFMPPLVGVAATTLSVGLGQTALPPMLMLSVAAFGFFATLGVILYDLRNTELYNAHVHRAMLIECSLEMPSHSRLASPNSYGGPHTLRMWADQRFLCMDVNHGTALSIVYAAILAAWVYPASRGALVLLGQLARQYSGLLSPEPGRILGSGSGNSTALGALVLAIVTGWIFYKRLRAADIPGSAEVCIYEDLNKARSEIKRKFEQKRRAFRRLIWKRKASNNDQLKSNYGRLMDLMKAKGLIQVKNDEVSLTKRGRRFHLRLVRRKRRQTKSRPSWQIGWWQATRRS